MNTHAPLCPLRTPRAHPYPSPGTLAAPIPSKPSYGSLVTPWKGPSRGHWLGDSRGVVWLPFEAT